MEDDDLPIGRILGRREAVRLLALSGAGLLVGCRRAEAPALDSNGVLAGAGKADSAPGAVLQCVAKPELTVGPYFVDRQLHRSDVREAKPGAPLTLTFNVQAIRGNTCVPLVGAMVDIWQCDAAGQYSAVNDRMVGFNTTDQKYLRGYQLTDDGGMAKFTTIYPGWYQGRTVHIHFKIRTHEDSATRDDASVSYEFTSQLFFDDALSDRVFAEQPYAAKGPRDMRNAEDGIYREAGNSLLLDVRPSGSGYQAAFSLGLDLSNKEIGARDRMGAGSEGRGRGRGNPPPGPPPSGRRLPPSGT